MHFTKQLPVRLFAALNFFNALNLNSILLRNLNLTENIKFGRKTESFAAVATVTDIFIKYGENIAKLCTFTYMWRKKQHKFL